jgi:eukaryotic-like serine/threonine-protein kinase
MTRQVIQRDKLGVLTKIGQGGQGVVYGAPNVKTKFAASMVYKEYKARTRSEIDFTALAAMPALVEDSLSYTEAERLVSIAAWPCALVEDNGASTGFVMPAIPEGFFIELTTAKGMSSSTAEFQHLLNHSSVLAARGIEIGETQRYSVLREVASGLAFLHRHGVCVGDISPKNLLFSLEPHAAVFFIDCDAMRIDAVSALPQVETPGWSVPSGEELATIYSDTYKLGLLALRLLAGDQDTKNPQHLSPATPALLRQIITETLDNAPERRPLPEAWTYVLGHAIEEAQHRKKTAADAAASTALVPPPTPIVHSRPSRRATPSRPPVASARFTPTVVPAPPMNATPATKTNLWPVAILAAAVVIAVVMAVVIMAVLRNANTNSAPTAQTTSTYPAGAAEPAYTSTTPVDPEAAAFQRLQDYKNGDASALAQVADRWIPQLASKHATQPWDRDPEDGLYYDSELTLQDHQLLRQRFGAILAWSGDWTVWVGPDYWVTVVPQTFSGAEGVLSWCNSKGLNRDHCSAQIVSKTQGRSGTHAYNR